MGWLAGLVLLASQERATRVNCGWQQEGGKQSNDSRGRGDRTGQEPTQSRNPKARPDLNRLRSHLQALLAYRLGGWSLIPNLLLIFKVLMLDCILDCYACQIYTSDYILLSFRYELSIEGEA